MRKHILCNFFYFLIGFTIFTSCICLAQCRKTPVGKEVLLIVIDLIIIFALVNMWKMSNTYSNYFFDSFRSEVRKLGPISFYTNFKPWGISLLVGFVASVFFYQFLLHS